MRTITLTYLSMAENAHNLHGFDEDTIFDAFERATEGRSFENRDGFTQHYALANFGLETYGIGFTFNEEGEAQIRTILSPSQVEANELQRPWAPRIESFAIDFA